MPRYTSSRRCSKRAWPSRSPRKPDNGMAPRSLARARVYQGSRRSSARLMRKPAAAFGGSKQLPQSGIERIGLFAGDGMAGARNDQQARCRHGALEKHAAIETGFVLVTNNDQERQRKFLQI